MFPIHWSPNSMIISMSHEQKYGVRIRYNSFGYTSSRYTFAILSLSLLNSSSNKIRRPRLLFFKFVFFNSYTNCLKKFCDRYKFAFAAYLSVPALIFGLQKMPQTLYLLFTLDFNIQGGIHIQSGELFFFFGNNNPRES